MSDAIEAIRNDTPEVNTSVRNDISINQVNTYDDLLILFMVTACSASHGCRLQCCESH